MSKLNGAQIYFTKKEIENLCDLFDAFYDIMPNQEKHAFWQEKTGTAQYKIFKKRDKLKQALDKIRI